MPFEKPDTKKNLAGIRNILLIGCGPHAQRIYVPTIQKLGASYNVKLVACVDIESSAEQINEFLVSRDINIRTLFLNKKEMTYGYVTARIKESLDRLIEELDIAGVIIATEPLVHMQYAKWALSRNLSILMDKPISTHFNVSTDPMAASQLMTDFAELKGLYLATRKRKPGISFSLMAQRRFHPAFRKLKDLINECFAITNCPVTSVQSFHSDGQWRMPAEIVSQLYHPYNQGYGKCSHSGYHFFDIVPWLIRDSYSPDKRPDNIQTTSTFVRPNDFLSQLNFKDYESIFGQKTFCELNPSSETTLRSIMAEYGELDAFNSFLLRRGKNAITHLSINLVHNGFGQRFWPSADDRDLYKGNGRIRHEYHIIEQGPFQALHYHSYQSKEVNPNDNSALYEPGGEHHLDLYVFRNAGIMKGKPEFEKIKFKDLNAQILEGHSRGHQEDARARGCIEFFESLNGLRPIARMTSDFLTHGDGVTLTSSAYLSAVRRFRGENPLVDMPFGVVHSTAQRKLFPLLVAARARRKPIASIKRFCVKRLDLNNQEEVLQ